MGQVQNVTVAEGREVDLDCQVKMVGGYKVQFMKKVSTLKVKVKLNI